MPRRASFSIILTFALLANVLGQQQEPAPAKQQQEPSAADDVVRINTTLVQVDAVVTDKDGKQVTDLNAEDFEIFEDGRAQQIKNFSYVTTVSAANPQSPPTLKSANSTEDYVAPLPTVRLRPEQVRRTVALVVDDLGLSFDSMAYVRQALKKYVAEQIQPGDLVAVICTSAGVGAMQQFTSDKRQLYAAIEHVKFYPVGRGRTSATPSISPIDNNGDGVPLYGNETNYQVNASSKEFFGGTIGALNFIARGLKDFPGRKSIVLMSDSLPITNKETLASGFMNAMKNLIEQANRSSVVIYTLDPRGLGKIGLNADDSVYNLAANQIDGRMFQRGISFHPSQDGLNYLAEQTGGLFFQGTNDLNAAMQRAMDDQKGYYLLAYKPDDSTLDPEGRRPGFHHLDVKLKRPGLTVRARSGFYSTTAAKSQHQGGTRDEQLRSALNSPFTAGDIHVQMTSLFAYDQQIGSYIRTMLHVDARDMTFSKEADGWFKASFDFATVSFDANGKVVDQVGRTHSMHVRSESFPRFLEDGFVYFTNLPVKKAGAYQLRVIVRDTATARTGAASQFIEVPNLKDNHIALSGVIVNGVPKVEATRANTSNTSAYNNASTNSAETLSASQSEQDIKPAADDENTRLSPAVRKFKRDEVMEFGYYIYNALLNQSGHPQIQTQLRLLRDGHAVFTGKMLPYEPSNQVDMKRIIAGGSLRLGKDLEPGDYILQVIVVDLLAQESHRITTQWIDFEILP